MQSNRVDRQSITGGVISSILPDSIGEHLGLQIGDIVTHINEVPLFDILDYRFQIAEEKAVITVWRQEEVMEFDVEKDYDEDLGVEFEDVLFDRIRRCQNNCDFCFIYQLPKKMRRSLYIKDDDHRLSFLYGNYVTLAGLTQADYDKITGYNLSPLYVSVHATPIEKRRELLRNDKAEEILERLQYLIDRGIEVYTQAVIVPDLNDGDVLEQTMEDLVQLYPGVRAFGIVPVGLTQYQSRLKRMNPHTVEEARATIAQIEAKQKEFIKRYGTPFMQIADEFYLKADLPVPDASFYDHYNLLENGIGAIRQFVDAFFEEYNPEEEAPQMTRGIITGEDGARMFRDYILPSLSPAHREKFRILEIKNRHFGESVSVSGLITGKDILEQITPGSADEYFLPANCLKFDQPVFLDDVAISEVESHLKRNIHILNPEGPELIEAFFNP